MHFFIKKTSLTVIGICFIACVATHAQINKKDSAAAVLPFAEPASASTYGESILNSKMIRRQHTSHLPKNAPNIVIVLLDDVGFGLPSTFGGEINTPTLSKIWNAGIAYNEFHTTAICSPSRAALLTGRNHTRVGNGTIAERAVDWDGYTGIIPKEAATVAQVLKDYGYATSAFGKWHNTPADQTTKMGPFNYWPVNYGFEHFYGFLGGEASQFEPRLINDFTPVEPPHSKDYHLTKDLADNAITWLKDRKAFAQDKPFFLYFAPGAGHGPHQIAKQWADKYKGKFDDGWDKYRERVFQRQKRMGWIPTNTQLTPRDSTMQAWTSIPENEKPFQRRLMEVFAGFVENADYEIGRLYNAIEAMGEKDNTIFIYIWGDNGSSAEGQNGSISELLAQNNIPNTIQQQIAALNTIGGLDALGTGMTDNIYHSSWAWAGNTPFKHTKLIASHFGGTRNELVISWPKGIKPDKTARSQFHHVNDIVPTIYDVLGITPPQVVNGFPQMALDGVSMKYTFADGHAPTAKKVQFFDNNGSRGIYKDGWYACTFGPLFPWLPGAPGLNKWDPSNDVWELYNLNEDYSQFTNLAAKEPTRLDEMKNAFLVQAKENKDLPIGAGIWLRLHPEDVITSPYKSWEFDQTSTRMPEFAAPGLGKKSNRVAIDVDIPANANGVLYALGGAGAGLSCYMENGKLYYEYNMFIIERTIIESKEKIAAGKHHIEIETALPKPGAAATVTITIDGKPLIAGEVKHTVPAAFSANETFDVGVDLGSPVSLRYHKKAPFAFTGKIEKLKVVLL